MLTAGLNDHRLSLPHTAKTGRLCSTNTALYQQRSSHQSYFNQLCHWQAWKQLSAYPQLPRAQARLDLQELPIA